MTVKNLLLSTLLGLASLSPAAAQDGPKLPPVEISEELTIPRQSVDVLDSTMSYLELGTGDPVLFLHGNPSSAYLWRNIMPYLGDTHRAIAPDLIGMGHSGKPDIRYSFAEHAEYLDAFIAKLGLTNITLVAHDWGAALAWNYARRNPDNVVRIAFMEGVLPPIFPQPSYEAMGEQMGGLFRALQDPVQGPEMVIDNNFFVQQILPMMINRPLGDLAKAEYNRPYEKAEDRKPTLTWPQEIPIGGKPADVIEMLGEVEAFMKSTDKPVLLLYAEPGAIVPAQVIPWYEANIKNLETGYVGQGLHFIQEDNPDAIGRELNDWVRRN